MDIQLIILIFLAIMWLIEFLLFLRKTTLSPGEKKRMERRLKYEALLNGVLLILLVVSKLTPRISSEVPPLEGISPFHVMYIVFILMVLIPLIMLKVQKRNLNTYFKIWVPLCLCLMIVTLIALIPENWGRKLILMGILLPLILLGCYLGYILFRGLWEK